MAQIFISYASHNRAFVADLAERLQARGVEAFVDKRDIAAGEPWSAQIAAALDAALCVIGVWDRRTLDSHYVQEECARALNKRKLIPVFLEEMDPDELPIFISTIHYLDWTDLDGGGFEALWRAVRRYLAPEATPTAPPPAEAAAPPMRPLIRESTTAESTNVATVLDDFRSNLLKVPDYQRESSQWRDDTKSLFIESIINNFAVPAFFFEPRIDEHGHEINEIVDGQQRLTTLLSFHNGEFPLSAATDVTYIAPNAAHYEGLYYDELPRIYQEAFNRYRLTIIKLRDLGEFRLEVFRRINQGGTPLSAQDIRLAYYGEGSRSISFIRLVGLRDLSGAPARSILRAARDKYAVECPWRDDVALERWRDFWGEPRKAIGQAASEMFLWCALAANFERVAKLAAERGRRAHLKGFNVQSGDDLLDLVCAQLQAEDQGRVAPTLFAEEDHLPRLFAHFSSFVVRMSGRKHIVPFKSRILGVLAGALYREEIRGGAVPDAFFDRLSDFIFQPKKVAAALGVPWADNKGHWNGPKSWSRQIEYAGPLVRRMTDT